MNHSCPNRELQLLTAGSEAHGTRQQLLRAGERGASGDSPARFILIEILRENP